MAIKAQLFSKIEGRTCVGAVFNGFSAPKCAKTYDRVTGVGKKGEFDIVSFYGEDNSIVQRVSRYLNDINGETLKTKKWNRDGSVIVETVHRNGVLKEVITDTFFYTDRENQILRQRERNLLNCENPWEIMSFSVFSNKQKPRKIIFSTNWDGKISKILYKNTKGELNCEGIEYLPLFIASRCKQPQINHLVKINERALDIEGIAPPIKLASYQELNSEHPTPKEARMANEISEGCTNPETAQVSIWRKEKSIERLVEIIAHEYFHVWQLISSARLEHNVRVFNLPKNSPAHVLSNAEIGQLKLVDPVGIQHYLEVLKVVKKALEKGVITKKNTDPALYWYLKRVDRYSVNNIYDKSIKVQGPRRHIVEVGAYRRQDQENEKFCNLFDNLNEILDIEI